MGGVFTDFPDVELVAVCDVFKPTRDDQAAKLGAKTNTKPDAVNDYRQVLDRKDVDALLVTTPDHWHGPLVIAASEAGKDCYCEKPLSNSIEVGQKMRAAVRQYKRVVQVGLQQRSWDHFQENAKRVQDGMIGKVYHVECIYQGNYTRDPGPPTDPPAGLDWELFQGSAARRPYVAMRQRSWRAFYDYSGGTLLDWGTHLTDVSHWYMKVHGAAHVQRLRPVCPRHRSPPGAVARHPGRHVEVPQFRHDLHQLRAPSPEFDVQGNHFLGHASAGCR